MRGRAQVKQQLKAKITQVGDVEFLAEHVELDAAELKDVAFQLSKSTFYIMRRATLLHKTHKSRTQLKGCLRRLQLMKNLSMHH